jgi:hypothetical protein
MTNNWSLSVVEVRYSSFFIRKIRHLFKSFLIHPIDPFRNMVRQLRLHQAIGIASW